MPSVTRGPVSTLSLLLTLLIPAACEKPFEPIAPSDLSFSIYGHLDAAADTQWVRVMPVRPSAETRPGPIDAVVTLEEMETGARVTMSDSLVSYQSITGVGELYAHNFSTTMPIVPGRHYRLTATGSNGRTASATTLIPTFENPSLQITGRSGSSPTGDVEGASYLAMVLSRQDVPKACNWPFPVHQEFLPVQDSRPTARGTVHRVPLGWSMGRRPPYVAEPPTTCPPGVALGPRRLLVIAASEPWPYDPTADLRWLTHPSSVNNIEGGIGFFAGLHTYTFPSASCTPARGRDSCTVTIDSQSATLVGLVTDGCTSRPPSTIIARLVGPPENGSREVRTDSAGIVSFPGLEPRTLYSLTLTDAGFSTQFDPVELNNISLSAGAVDTISIEMPRSCTAV